MIYKGSRISPRAHFFGCGGRTCAYASHPPSCGSPFGRLGHAATRTSTGRSRLAPRPLQVQVLSSINGIKRRWLSPPSLIPWLRRKDLNLRPPACTNGSSIFGPIHPLIFPHFFMFVQFLATLYGSSCFIALDPVNYIKSFKVSSKSLPLFFGYLNNFQSLLIYVHLRPIRPSRRYRAM